MKDCIFCKIARKEIPSNLLYEDDNVVAFMDISPLNKGHLLVIPKNHYAQLHEMPESEGLSVFKAVLRLEKALRKSSIELDGTNILQNNGSAAGQEVFHVHFHVIPRLSSDKVGFNFSRLSLSTEEIGESAELIKKALH